ncbi:MAG: helix-hairpin-helix domain-containing protein [Clostridia bacterium]|nr:helix-hairpin-helix domain-containing protein [Clostridia bacterium]
MNDRKSVLLLIAAALVIAAVLAAFKAFDSPAMNAAQKVSVTLTHREETAVKGKVNINTAGIEELMTLENIGEAKAAQIIEYRNKNGNFRSIEELMNIEGIGGETVEANRSRIII